MSFIQVLMGHDVGSRHRELLSLVDVGDLSSLECFDTVDDRKGIWDIKTCRADRQTPI